MRDRPPIQTRHAVDGAVQLPDPDQRLRQAPGSEEDVAVGPEDDDGVDVELRQPLRDLRVRAEDGVTQLGTDGAARREDERVVRDQEPADDLGHRYFPRVESSGPPGAPTELSSSVCCRSGVAIRLW